MMRLTLVLLVALVMACSQDTEEVPQPESVPTVQMVSPSPIPQPTATPSPTPTPVPTATPTPSPTPVPTPTPVVRPRSADFPKLVEHWEQVFADFSPESCGNLFVQSGLDVEDYAGMLGYDDTWRGSWGDAVADVNISDLADFDRAVWQTILAKTQEVASATWMFEDASWALACVPLWSALVTEETQYQRNPGNCIPLPSDPSAHWVLQAVYSEIYQMWTTPYLETTSTERYNLLAELGPSGCGVVYPQLFYGLWIPAGLQ